MNKSFAFIICFILVHPIIAQDVEWASKIISFSSELSSKQYSASQVLGKPDVLPEGGDSPNAWLSSNPNGEEFIKVGFDHPKKIQQIAIAESYNPSAISQLFAYDAQDNEYLIATFTPRPIDLNGRLLNVFFDRTEFEVHAIKIILRGISVQGYNGIDAIGIADSRDPINVSIDLLSNVSNNLDVEKLDNNVNSEYQEARPVVAPDGKTLYFSRRNHPENMGGTEDPEDIWYSNFDLETQEWMTAKNIGPPLNNSGTNFISSVTPDGNAMTVILGNRYQKNENMKPGVSISTKSSEGWSKPEELNIINAFIENNDGDYFIAQNRKTLLLAVERFDAFGGKDIYVSFQMGDDNWTEPLNLGNDINTANIESAPFLAADNETLYFSSKGFSGFGGSDIYMSRRLDDTWQSWTKPENLGNSLNSVEDDIFFNIPPSGKYAYFTKANTEYDADIYRIKLPIFFQPAPVITMNGKIYNSETLKPIKARISYEILPEKTEVGYTVSDSLTGQYEIVLPVGSKIKYIVDMEGYNLLVDSIDLMNLNNYQEINRNLYIDPDQLTKALSALALKSKINTEKLVKKDNEKFAEIEDAIEINEGILSVRVQFDFDSYKIKKDSYQDLDRIINLLKSTPVDIIIAGHTCDIGVESYNKILSESRAKAVYKYLINQGVDREKMVTTGYGEERPIESNSTLAGKQKNRRVEFIRKDQFILYNIKFEEN